MLYVIFYVGLVIVLLGPLIFKIVYTNWLTNSIEKHIKKYPSELIFSSKEEKIQRCRTCKEISNHEICEKCFDFANKITIMRL